MLSYSSAGSGGAGGLDSPLEFFEPPCMKIVPTPLLLYGNAFWGGLGVILAGGPAHCRYATVNNAPTAETLKQMQSYFGTTNAGWLSKYVVDSYVSIVVAKSNKAVGSEEFGFLEIDNTLSIIEERAIGNLKAFTATICVSQTLT